MSRRVSVFVCLFSALAMGSALLGCGTSREAAWDTTPAVAAADTSEEAVSRRDQLLNEGREAWAGRDEEASVDTAIQRFQAALEIDGTDYETWVSLSRALYFKADCHVRFDQARNAEFMSTFEEGTRAAERSLMALSSDFAERMQNGTRIEEAVSVLDARAVPALYWRSSNLGKWASADGFATLLSYKDEIRAIMQFCLENDQEYYYYGPDRYFGVFYARAPSFAGGDLERSREHFETSLRQYENYFATHVLMAQDYAVKAQDRSVFDARLAFVLDGDPESIPEVAPENRCEQRKARELQGQADEFFE